LTAPATPIVTPPTANARTNGAQSTSTQQQQTSPQLPTLQNIVAMAVVPHSAGNGAVSLVVYLQFLIPPGQAGHANNRGNAYAIQQQRFAANAVMAGVLEVPIVVNEADTAAIRCTHRVNNMDAIDGINRAMLEVTVTNKMIVSTIGRARTTAQDPPVIAAAAAAAAAASSSTNLGIQIDSLYKHL
jgi:hypothetical protein